METLRLTVDVGDLESEASRKAIAQAAEILRAGGTVAFPTETVYGLGANALDAAAVEKIFAAKERPGWDPLIVHVGDRAMLSMVAREVSQDAHRLMEAFWPGPLTLLAPKHARIPEIVTAGLEKVGVRMPAHPVAHALLVAAGVPVAAPSANRFGRISPTSAYHVAEDLDGRIDAILDGGETTHGVESTVVDAQEGGCVIYRPGIITLEQLRSVCRGEVVFRTELVESEAAAPAPGMGVRHYAPRARLVLVEGIQPGLDAALMVEVNRLEEAGEVVGVMAPGGFEAALRLMRKKPFDARGFAMGYDTVHVYNWGSWEKPEELAHKLYAGLRWLDAAGVTAIVCPLPEPVGIGLAVRDRLLRAGNRQ
ncbi:MAG: L-threonylcarbamoyladenylate synthase [Acidobacteriaceae bacterium]